MSFERYREYITERLRELDENDLYFMWQIATLLKKYLEEKQGRQET